MSYKRFEDLPVWNAAADLALKVFEFTVTLPRRGSGDIVNQLNRSVLSISNNIAEGFERGTTRELVSFLYYAKGSAGEVRSMLGILQRRPGGEAGKQVMEGLKADCESVARQLRGWAASLQESGIEGQRHLNERTRRQYEQEQRRDKFVAEMKERMKEIEAERKAAEEAKEAGGRGAI